MQAGAFRAAATAFYRLFQHALWPAWEMCAAIRFVHAVGAEETESLTFALRTQLLGDESEATQATDRMYAAWQDWICF